MKRHALMLVLGLPPKELLKNARPHRMARAAAIKAYRQEAKVVTLEAVGRAPRSLAAGMPYRHATATATFYLPDRRRRDKHNLPQTLHPVWDGLQVERKSTNPRAGAWIGAGLIVDDQDLDVMPHRVEVDKARPRVEIVLELE